MDFTPNSAINHLNLKFDDVPVSDDFSKDDLAEQLNVFTNPYFLDLEPSSMLSEGYYGFVSQPSGSSNSNKQEKNVQQQNPEKISTLQQVKEEEVSNTFSAPLNATGNFSSANPASIDLAYLDLQKLLTLPDHSKETQEKTSSQRELFEQKSSVASASKDNVSSSSILQGSASSKLLPDQSARQHQVLVGQTAIPTSEASSSINNTPLQAPVSSFADQNAFTNPLSTFASPDLASVSSPSLSSYKGAQSPNANSKRTKATSAIRTAAEEDKRRRNTAASARFRIKKKLKEQQLERTAKELTEKVAILETRVRELEMENNWLKGLIRPTSNF
ncbi:Transcription factor zip1 [Schizosaccharomyces pombe]|uniref:Transcription factor zip1 n=1 Tax=Schizosaccharomyces pombe (strain 972 / ATCC 24843) TaxID=284812 RepID=ZIP1_SCHPO|nr:transcription factor Zip1 [Schizosaccharomyces pombe]Q10424.1 RecName: Full=Transcription factor zip1 [Schizosaccharomyces pombe 972h-]CAA94632.1 transcription factor Zip1 [Schizosaccharomyces pombe]|eukprot:NP_001342821.1 transcription factor Zip1 [Schizosaccharomyces pombe]